MNQILVIQKDNINKKAKKNYFLVKFQLIFSIIILIVLLFFTMFYFFTINLQATSSSNLLANYNVLKLYSSNNTHLSSENLYDICGSVEIPKLDIHYTIFSNITEDLLKISPCKVFGDIGKPNNSICIAGHNYNNSMFFSNINTLSLNDKIFLYDNNDFRYIYTVNSIYEIDEKDLTSLLDSKFLNKLILVTCNNFNSKRIILEANKYNKNDL